MTKQQEIRLGLAHAVDYIRTDETYEQWRLRLADKVLAYLNYKGMLKEDFGFEPLIEENHE